MSTPIEVWFFPNGNTAAFKEGAQIPELQKSWLTLYVHFLEMRGIDPETVKFRLPGDSIAYAFKIPEGWNWRIE